MENEGIVFKLVNYHSNNDDALLTDIKLREKQDKKSLVPIHEHDYLSDKAKHLSKKENKKRKNKRKIKKCSR